jgi:hypothetical protein
MGRKIDHPAVGERRLLLHHSFAGVPLRSAAAGSAAPHRRRTRQRTPACGKFTRFLGRRDGSRCATVTCSTRSRRAPCRPPPKHDRFNDGKQIVDKESEQSHHNEQRVDLRGLEVPLGLNHQRSDARQRRQHLDQQGNDDCKRDRNSYAKQYKWNNRWNDDLPDPFCPRKMEGSGYIKQ